MKNIKQFFTYLVVGALVIALSISCKSNENPVDEEKVGENPPAGEYTDSQDKVTVSADGTISGGLVYPISDSESRRINFNVTINSWYTYGDGYHYAKGGSYTVKSITPDGYTFADDYPIAWRNLNGKTLLSININGNGAGFKQLTLN